MRALIGVRAAWSAALVLACAVPAARAQEASAEAGRPGDPQHAVRTVRVHLYDTRRFTPARVVVRQGDTVRFLVHNAGTQVHTLALGTPPALQRQSQALADPAAVPPEGAAVRLKPGTSGRFVWQFTQPGSFQFACIEPGHLETGMVGTIIVKERIP